MSGLPRLGSPSTLNSLTGLDTSQATKALAEYRSSHADAVPYATRSAPAEKSKYQLWPAVDQRITKPLPGPPELAAVPTPDPKCSVRVHPSIDQLWLFYRKGEERRSPLSKPRSKRTQSSPKIIPQPTLEVTDNNIKLRSNRRSYSAPGRTGQGEVVRPRDDVSTREQEQISPSPPSGDDDDDDDEEEKKEEALAADELRRSLKRASSVVLPAELADVIFPKLQRRAFDSEGKKIEAPCPEIPADLSRRCSETEVPPAVPPKVPARKPVPNLRVSPLKLRPTIKGSTYNKALPQIGASASPQKSLAGSCNSQGSPGHMRDRSGDSVVDRGRPTTRHQGQSTNGLITSAQGSSVDLTNDILPRGWSANSVFENLLRDEIRKLEQQARSQVGRFEVLRVKDVKTLSQQVLLLDEQCEYLRGFVKSLRRNRRALQIQTIAYLKSPALSEIPRQTMLQKVETLADLDDTIDEWSKKLERAQDQRLRTRQRLLEHIAAVLAMPSVLDGKEAARSAAAFGPVHSPPQSPEGLENSRMTAGYDGESIKIYAGTEMHALLGILGKETSALGSAENVI